MVAILYPYRKSHIINDAFSAIIGPEHKIGPMFGFTEHVGNTIDRGLSLVIIIYVIVSIGIRRRHYRRDHESVHLRLGFL